MDATLALGVALLATFLLNVAACAMMATSFGIVFWRGGWKPAMAELPGGKWPLARWLMMCGAAFGVAVSVLYVAVVMVIPRWLGIIQ